jgi:hypothetical protein
MSLLCCSEHVVAPLPSSPGASERPSFTVTPIYDSTGTPTITSFSDNTELTTTGGVVGYSGTDAQTTRLYAEEYNWSEPNATWDINLSFASGDLPFGSSYAPVIDVAQAGLMFGVTAPDIRDRVGTRLLISSTRPPLDVDGQSSTPVVLPSSASPDIVAPARHGGSPGNMHPPLASSAGVALALGRPGAAVRDSIRRARRAAVVERMVITPRGRARLIARLRARFQEAAGPGGVRIFTRHSGPDEVRITFDPMIGGVSQTETLNDGHLRSRSVNRYATVQGVTVLSEITTTIFDATGAPMGTITERHTNVTVH